MVRAVARFIDCQSVAEEWLSFGQSIRGSEKSSEIAQSICHCGVFGTKRPLVYLQGLFKKVLRCG
jgi:hypothetical protein